MGIRVSCWRPVHGPFRCHIGFGPAGGGRWTCRALSSKVTVFAASPWFPTGDNRSFLLQFQFFCHTGLFCAPQPSAMFAGWRLGRWWLGRWRCLRRWWWPKLNWCRELMPCGRVLRLHDDVECLRLDIRGLRLDRQCIRVRLPDSELVNLLLAGDDMRPARLARLARQQGQIVIDLSLACPLESFGRTSVLVHYGKCEIRPPDRDRSTAVVDDLRPKMIDDARAALPIC